MDTSIKERQIAEFCRKDLLEENQSQVIKVSCKTGRDVRMSVPQLVHIFMMSRSLIFLFEKRIYFGIL
jgi:hypothetical protein